MQQETDVASPTELYHKQYLQDFIRATKRVSLLKILFFSLMGLQILLFFILLETPYFALLAATFGLFFLTIFSYFVLLFYFQAKIPEILETFHEKWVRGLVLSESFSENLSQNSVFIAQKVFQFLPYFDDYEKKYFTSFSAILDPLFTRLAVFFHKEDVFAIKEKLLFTAIEQYFEQIRKTPTDIELHAMLAKGYVHLAKLYKSEMVTLSHLAKIKKKDLIAEKLQGAITSALEEYKIIAEYAPKDPWVHSQLAACYRELDMPRQEVEEYLHLLQISPHDYEMLFRLGVLYFSLGEEAKGLKIYETLKEGKCNKAEDLLLYYGKRRLQKEKGQI